MAVFCNRSQDPRPGVFPVSFPVFWSGIHSELSCPSTLPIQQVFRMIFILFVKIVGLTRHQYKQSSVMVFTQMTSVFN